MKKHYFLILSIVLEAAVILMISLANRIGGTAYYFFYNLLYGLLLSTAVPLYFAAKRKEPLSSFGIKPLRLKQFAVLIVFVIFSVGGQLSRPDIRRLRFDLIPVCIVPLVMTTFFEEFLFRGFLQTRLEKRYGWLPAVLLSGFFFSAYHIGYPGFRDGNDLMLLFAVGTGFALSYKLSGNNLIVAYFVNFPNAVLTYVLKSRQFPRFDGLTTVMASVSILLILAIVLLVPKILAKRAGSGAA